MNYYNEIDPFAAKWLADLMRRGLIPYGDIDTRSIEDVQPRDLAGYTQCHFFAGIGGWSRALELVGWQHGKPVWTGSCPCQPFSVAGEKKGNNDSRNLWPEFVRLIGECKPTTVFGEQVASNLGRAWLAGVRSDLEAVGYAVGAADLCAASINAPHIRQRLWWVADAQAAKWRSLPQEIQRWRITEAGRPSGDFSCRLADTRSNRRQGRGQRTWEKLNLQIQADRLCNDGGKPHAHKQRLQECKAQKQPANEKPELEPCGVDFWEAAIWQPCTDGKARRIPIEPALFPVAYGIPNRVGLLRGAGNAIVPQVAAVFIQAFLSIGGK